MPHLANTNNTSHRHALQTRNRSLSITIKVQHTSITHTNVLMSTKIKF
jgi:hypothetical protein